ncbi:benzoate 4-monooxygenase cytochrome P450 [Aspergillus homomorphus CBS 101889]|uniref:Benzoate 4-monooxygenase cytochrome P450 n=1 Tax=Aspergillus homomorphus (strain CBS 101889) TaxID=1450537 RepID=A0A395HQ87_ASPHC|nr:benzoate 4-monooxygenase cytochrome P450 [Aspergillus homomorphus CBS 101889]RAL09776.1 benzoate 4-monooxygenase cytochrome P450 [Aspergillus homomorphus CBS 101889]
MYVKLLLVVCHILFFYYGILPLINYFRDPKGLRKYPKPSFWSGISNLPLVIESRKGTRYKRLFEAHKKHPTLRTGPNTLSYADHKAIKDIYGHSTTCTKDLFYSITSGSHFHLADVIDRSEHPRKRKVLSSAYALKNLESREYKDLTVDYRMWTNLFTIAAIANIGNDLITSESMDGTVKRVRFGECHFANGSATSTLVWCYDWYQTSVKASKLFSTTFRRTWKLRRDWDGIVYSRSNNRLKRYLNGEKLDDFFSAMMADKNGGPHNLEWGEVIAEVSIMINAGSDTTAIALANTMLLLLRNLDCLQKLREEVDNVMNEDEIVAPYDKVKHLPYLRACLDESMRLHPPVSFALPRRTPPEGTTILSEFVPGNTSVGISAYVVHRNETIFPDSEAYKPELWLGEKGKDLQPYFVAFSTGARGCIGRNISYLEQTVLIASLVHRYEFALPHPTWEPTPHETTNTGLGAIPIKIWRWGEH